MNWSPWILMKNKKETKDYFDWLKNSWKHVVNRSYYICFVNSSKFGPPQSTNKKTAHLWTFFFLSDIRTAEGFLLHSFLVGKTSAHCGSNSLALFLILSENGSRRHCKKKVKVKQGQGQPWRHNCHVLSFTKKISKLLCSIY